MEKAPPKRRLLMDRRFLCDIHYCSNEHGEVGFVINDHIDKGAIQIYDPFGHRSAFIPHFHLGNRSGFGAKLVNGDKGLVQHITNLQITEENGEYYAEVVKIANEFPPEE